MLQDLICCLSLSLKLCLTGQKETINQAAQDERRSGSNALRFSAARKGSWRSESGTGIRSQERLCVGGLATESALKDHTMPTEALRSFGTLDQQQYVVSSAGLKIVTTRRSV